MLQTISISMIKNVKDKSGIHLFLTSTFIGIVFLQYSSKDNPDFLPIYITLFLYLITLAVFLLEEPENIAFIFLFTLQMAIKLFFHSDQNIKKGLFEFMFITLIAVIIFEAKFRLVKLNRYKIDSLKQTHYATLSILGKVSEIKDLETANHHSRVEIMIGNLAIYLKKSEKYVEDIKTAAYLHDIGKIGIPDSIINKKGNLTPEEYEFIQSHTTIGYNLIKEAQNRVEDKETYKIALEIVRHHHERWDGTGYPDKLKGDEIPLSARIMAIVDVYDALVSKRSYKDSLSHDEAIIVIKSSSGSHFDPVITDVFIKNASKIYDEIKIHLN